MKKILDFNWLRAVQLKCNTSVKSVTPVQITNRSKNFKTNLKKKNQTMKKKERIREEKKKIYFITRVDEKRREKCCCVSLFTLAKLNEFSLAKLFKPLHLEKTNELKISSNNWP